MRSWPGLAAIGAGLIHLGIAAGSSPLQLVAFLLPGAVEVGWGVLALARPEAARFRSALVAAALLVAVQLLALLATGHGGQHGTEHAAMRSSGLPFGAIAGATVLDLAVAATVAVRVRRGSGRDPGAVGFLLGTIVGAAAVAFVTVSSLAGTAVGAQPMTH